MLSMFLLAVMRTGRDRTVPLDFAIVPNSYRDLQLLNQQQWKRIIRLLRFLTLKFSTVVVSLLFFLFLPFFLS